MALPDSIHLEIVTPEKLLFSGRVDSVTVPASTGYLGILPGHAPLLAELGIGEISYGVGNRFEHFSCFWGFLEVLPDRVIILAQSGEAASDIDVKRAEEAKARAEKRLASKDPGVDFGLEQITLLRALSRIGAARRSGSSHRPRP
jgi:F-type H+-transporting ATPase subunit epsilon